jgi:transitional endoplasmic reticulum ATPase
LPGTGDRSPAPVTLWLGFAGMRQLRAELEQDVIRPLREPELYAKYDLTLPNGILLHGPPGCGKTFLAQTLARIIGFRFFDITPSDLGSIYVHGGQKLIKSLFDKAAAEAPSMIFLDEFDALAPERRGGAAHHYEAEVNELLTQLNECSRRRVLVVAATNHASKIDPAVLRPGRFDKHFFVGPPDLEARVELFRLYLAKRPAAGVNYLKLGALSERYTPAEIRAVVDDAARKALARRDPISQDDLEGALTADRPTPAPPSTDPPRVKDRFGTAMPRACRRRLLDRHRTAASLFR